MLQFEYMFNLFNSVVTVSNASMLQYGLAEDTSRSGGQDNAPSDLYSQSAIYVAAAHALKPNYSVWRFL